MLRYPHFLLELVLNCIECSLNQASIPAREQHKAIRICLEAVAGQGEENFYG